VTTTNGITFNSGIIQTHHIPDSISWAVLLASTPFYFLLYMYLDAVIQNTFGIAKHPLFCFMKEKTSQEDESHEKFDPEVQNTEVYNSQDPILLQMLTK